MHAVGRRMAARRGGGKTDQREKEGIAVVFWERERYQRKGRIISHLTRAIIEKGRGERGTRG